MQDLIDKLILYGFPEECATEIICDMVDLVDELRTLMENAPDDRTRMEFEKMISKMEQMR